MFFSPGQEVYQGLEDYKLCTAVVKEYNPHLQQLTLLRVNGTLKNNESIFDLNGNELVVIKEGQADVIPQINGSAIPAGKFIDSTSLISNRYSVIQDSYYYQLFSYTIHSTLPQSEYKSYVNKLTHPSGFIMFSSMKLHDKVCTQCNVTDVTGSFIIKQKNKKSKESQPPSNPRIGNLWFNQDQEKTYIYFYDGTYPRWIDITTPSSKQLVETLSEEFLGTEKRSEKSFRAVIVEGLPSTKSFAYQTLIFNLEDSKLYVNTKTNDDKIKWLRVVGNVKDSDIFTLSLRQLNNRTNLLLNYTVPISSYSPVIRSVPLGTLWFNYENKRLFILHQNRNGLVWIPIIN